jgi:hypothetical protein
MSRHGAPGLDGRDRRPPGIAGRGQLTGERAQGGRGEVEAQEFDGDPGDGDFGLTDSGVELVEAVLELLKRLRAS